MMLQNFYRSIIHFFFSLFFNFFVDGKENSFWRLSYPNTAFLYLAAWNEGTEVWRN